MSTTTTTTTTTTSTTPGSSGPANKAFSRLERFYITKEATYGTAVLPSASNACHHIKLDLNNTVALLKRRDKTGSRTAITGTRGRVIGKWSYDGTLYATGTAGQKPDADLLFQMIFGGPGAAVTGGYGYTLADTTVSTNLWSYRTPSTIEQRVALGAIVNNFQFNLGQDIAEFTVDGECLYVQSSAMLANTPDVNAKGGLSSFPAEPSMPTYNDGGAVAGFTGAIQIDGQTLAFLRNATIKGSTGNVLTTDTFGSFVPTGSEGDVREYKFAFSCYDDDTTGLGMIKEAADSKTPVSATVQIGTKAGNIHTFQLNGIQLESPNYDDSNRAYVLNIAESQFVGSNPTALDELSYTIS